MSYSIRIHSGPANQYQGTADEGRVGIDDEQPSKGICIVDADRQCRLRCTFERLSFSPLALPSRN